jgi:diaminopimelate decarboxylase
VHLNVDLLSQLDRVGRRCRGRGVGLRLNPRAGVMRGHAASLYSDTRPTKFGIYEEDLPRALALAARHGLSIDTAHVHLANGMLDDELPAFDAALGEFERMVRLLLEAGCPLTEVNVGGGLGTPRYAGERPLDLDAYAGVVARHFGDLDVALGVEPGEYLTNESAVLLSEVVTVESRLGEGFVGLDCGWNVMNERHIYGHEIEFVVCGRADAPRRGSTTVAGHINEGDDLFAEHVPFPEVAEGDIVAMVSVGGYCQAMFTEHCLRPRATTVCFGRRDG